MNAGIERELRLGHVVRTPAEIAADLHTGAASLAEIAEGWIQAPPITASVVSSAQGTAAGLQKLLLDLRAAVHAQESSRAA